MKGRRRPVLYMVITVAILSTIYIYTELKGTMLTKPPRLHAYMSEELKIEGVLGTYSWKSLGTAILADSDHPSMFEYLPANILEVSSGQRVYVTPLVERDQIPFEIVRMTVSKKGKPETEKTLDFSINGEAAVIIVPEDQGDFVYTVHVDFPERGEAVYGLEVFVDMQAYHLEELERLKTPYVGNASAVAEIMGSLPLPGSGYVQRYISLETEKEPYGITVYYEPKEEMRNHLVYPEAKEQNAVFRMLEKNALVLLALVDNADQVTFRVKNTPSGGTLEKSPYEKSISFLREELTEKYGPLDGILSHRELFKSEKDN